MSVRVLTVDSSHHENDDNTLGKHDDGKYKSTQQIRENNRSLRYLCKAAEDAADEEECCAVDINLQILPQDEAINSNFDVSTIGLFTNTKSTCILKGNDKLATSSVRRKPAREQLQEYLLESNAKSARRSKWESSNVQTDKWNNNIQQANLDASSAAIKDREMESFNDTKQRGSCEKGRDKKGVVLDDTNTFICGTQRIGGGGKQTATVFDISSCGESSGAATATANHTHRSTVGWIPLKEIIRKRDSRLRKKRSGSRDNGVNDRPIDIEREENEEENAEEEEEEDEAGQQQWQKQKGKQGNVNSSSDLVANKTRFFVGREILRLSSSFSSSSSAKDKHSNIASGTTKISSGPNRQQNLKSDEENHSPTTQEQGTLLFARVLSNAEEIVLNLPLQFNRLRGDLRRIMECVNAFHHPHLSTYRGAERVDGSVYLFSNYMGSPCCQRTEDGEGGLSLKQLMCQRGRRRERSNRNWNSKRDKHEYINGAVNDAAASPIRSASPKYHREGGGDGGAFREALAATILKPAVAATSFLHAQGLLAHHGLKASNNLLISIRGGREEEEDEDDGAEFSSSPLLLRMCDYGTRFVFFGDEAAGGGSSLSGQRARWLPPEALRGEALTAASDTWGVGCLLLELLTNKPPFSHLTEGFATVDGVNTNEDGGRYDEEEEEGASSQSSPTRVSPSPQLGEDPIDDEISDAASSSLFISHSCAAIDSDRAHSDDDACLLVAAHIGGPDSEDINFLPENVLATLSEECKDFLRCCFQKDPSKRWPTCALLSHHPFLTKNGVGGAEIKLTENRHSSLSIHDHIQEAAHHNGQDNHQGYVSRSMSRCCEEKRQCTHDVCVCAPEVLLRSYTIPTRAVLGSRSVQSLGMIAKKGGSAKARDETVDAEAATTRTTAVAGGEIALRFRRQDARDERAAKATEEGALNRIPNDASPVVHIRTDEAAAMLVHFLPKADLGPLSCRQNALIVVLTISLMLLSALIGGILAFCFSR